MFELRGGRSAVRAVFSAAAVAAISGCSQPAAPSSPSTFTVHAVTPNLGSTLGPTSISISGLGFSEGARVTVDGIDAVVSDRRVYALTAVAPAHAAGHVDIVVTNGDGKTSTVPTGFTYVAPSQIVIASLSPTNVLANGGAFSIHGSGFLPGATVTIDRVEALSTFVDGSQLRVTAPAHSAGLVDVTVTNAYTDTVVFAGALTYTALPPLRVDHVDPTVGSTAGGALLLIYGTSLQEGATVVVDGQSLRGTMWEFADGVLSVDMPPHAKGPVDLVVTNPDGETYRLPSGFSYAPPQSFSFTGSWYAYLRPRWNGYQGIRVENNTVTRLWCGSEITNLIPTPLPLVTDGAFSFTPKGGGHVEGHMVAAGQAAGTISVPGCVGPWYAYASGDLPGR